MSNTAPKISGPGLLYVSSGIAKGSPLTEESYIKWYSNDHIPEIIQTSGIHSAIRFKDVKPEASKPYLVIYPMEDIGFTQGEEFKNIRATSDLLPEGKPIYDMVDLDIRYYGLVEKYDPKGTKEGQVKLLLTAALDVGGGITEQEYHDYYGKEHFGEVGKTKGFLRATRYKLLYHRSNAKSRQLKGLPPQEGDHAIHDPPAFLAMFEFDREDLDYPALMKTGETEWSKKVLGTASRIETPVFRHVENYGDGKLFH